MMLWTKGHDVITFTFNTFILRSPGVPNFADIIKIATILVNIIF